MHKLSEEVEKLRKYNVLAEKVIERVQDLRSEQLSRRVLSDMDQLLQSQETAQMMHDDLTFVCKFGTI